MLNAIGKLCLLVAILAPAPISIASAAYPEKPVRIVVPFAAGGTTDVIARLVAQKLSETFKTQFYVENRAGAGGNIGIQSVARSQPDGYTLLFASSSYVVNPSLYANRLYDPYKDFAPVTLAVTSANVFAVHPSVPAKTMKELVDLIRQSPGKFNISNPGVGTTPQLAGELLRSKLSLDFTSVGFGGAGPALQSAVGGHTQILVSAVPPAAPQVKSDGLRAMAVTSNKRTASLPDVPTMAEAGFPDQESETMQGVFAPAGTSREIVDRLHAEIIAILKKSDVVEKCAELGFDIVANTPEEFTGYIRAEIDKWAKVIDEAKIEKFK